jgi:hypothetical protein
MNRYFLLLTISLTSMCMESDDLPPLEDILKNAEATDADAERFETKIIQAQQILNEAQKACLETRTRLKIIKTLTQKGIALQEEKESLCNLVAATSQHALSAKDEFALVANLNTVQFQIDFNQRQLNLLCTPQNDCFSRLSYWYVTLQPHLQALDQAPAESKPPTK